MPSAATLSTRALNRALLERQILLRRHTRSVPDTIEHLVGLQAQVPANPYVALWSRLESFNPDSLSQLLLSRQAVRIAVMRSTLHLLTARDCIALRTVMQPAMSRALYQSSGFGKRIQGIDVDALLAAGRAFLEEQPRPLTALRAHLAARWPEYDSQSLSYAVHYLLPLVQVPPRGVWGASHQPTCTTAEHWLGQPLSSDTSPDSAFLRYLAAFGPASVSDAQTWSGLTGLRAVADRLRPQLRTFQDERGRELFDLPDAPLPDPDLPAPPRLLPEYDNIWLSHQDRTRIVPEPYRQQATFHVGQGVALVDGFTAATWKHAESKDTSSATLTITPFHPLSPTDRHALSDEAARLLTFLSPTATSQDVQLLSPLPLGEG